MPDISNKIPGQANRLSVKIFDGASDQDIRMLAESLADGPLGNPVAITKNGNVWARTANDGTKINLRNFSTSEPQTGARWTIDIINQAKISPLNVGKGAGKVELKFR